MYFPEFRYMLKEYMIFLKYESYLKLGTKLDLGLQFRGERSWLLTKPLDLGSIPSAAKINGRFILASSAIHLITVVPVCLLNLT